MGFFFNFSVFIFYVKWIEGFINFHLRPHFLKWNVYVGREQNFSKKCRKNEFFLEILNWKKKHNFARNIRRQSDKLSFETLFIEIGWEFSEGYIKTLYRFLNSASRSFIWVMNNTCTIYVLNPKRGTLAFFCEHISLILTNEVSNESYETLYSF